MDFRDLTVDWSRCVTIDTDIDEDLLKRLAEPILRLRQESTRPITVALNSNGGSVAIMEKLIALLTGPDQDGNHGFFVAVVIDHAYSAAATLLARASYAVALRHTEILCHDVRYSGLRDVTPGFALTAAKSLQQTNESASLKLADAMFNRWMWAYLDVKNTLDKVKASEPNASKTVADALAGCSIPVDVSNSKIKFDLHGFIVWIYSRLRPENEVLIDNAAKKLWQWGIMMAGATQTPQYRAEDGSVPGMLDGPLHMYRQLIEKPDSSLGSAAFEKDLNLFLVVVTSTLFWEQNRSPSATFEAALSDFLLIKSIDDPSHARRATEKILDHKYAFLDFDAREKWKYLSKDERLELIGLATPVVKTAWLFCVLIARELFTGDHMLNPVEALSLGLIDEIAGDTRVQSRRQFRKQQQQEESQAQPEPIRFVRRQSTGSQKPFWRRKSPTE